MRNYGSPGQRRRNPDEQRPSGGPSGSLRERSRPPSFRTLRRGPSWRRRMKCVWVWIPVSRAAFERGYAASFPGARPSRHRRMSLSRNSMMYVSAAVPAIIVRSAEDARRHLRVFPGFRGPQRVGIHSTPSTAKGVPAKRPNPTPRSPPRRAACEISQRHSGHSGRISPLDLASQVTG
jgi:hypothetical protein